MQIRYINLESFPDRDYRMRSMLAHHRLENLSERFPGVISSKQLNGMSLSETGCLLAHQSLLMSLNDDESTLILEDDISLCTDFREMIDSLVIKVESSEIDIFFLGQTVPSQNLAKHAKLLKLLRKYKENNKRLLLDADPYYSYGTFAYIVNRHSISKIKALFHTLDFSKSAKPTDELLGHWFRQGVLKGRIVFPYLAGIESGLETTMFDRRAAHNHAQQAELVNLYLDGYTPKEAAQWETIISANPNLHALEICKSIYMLLTRE